MFRFETDRNRATLARVLPILSISKLTKTYASGLQALKDVSLFVPAGELVALLGPSGSGKTTLLRIIAGLETADQGSILFHGEDTTEQKLRDRKVGFVFQHFGLLPTLTVA